MVYRGTGPSSYVVGCLLAGTGLLTACASGPHEVVLPPVDSGSAGVSVPASDGSTSGTATSSAAGSDALIVHAGAITAADARARQAGETWMAYWKARGRAYHDVVLDPVALGQVASGTAYTDVASRVAQLKAKGNHTAGEFTVSVTSVTVKADAATLDSCMLNRAIDVDARGHPVEPMTPAYRLRGTLAPSGASWRVTAVEVVKRGSC